MLIPTSTMPSCKQRSAGAMADNCAPIAGSSDDDGKAFANLVAVNPSNQGGDDAAANIRSEVSDRGGEVATDCPAEAPGAAPSQAEMERAAIAPFPLDPACTTYCFLQRQHAGDVNQPARWAAGVSSGKPSSLEEPPRSAPKDEVEGHSGAPAVAPPSTLVGSVKVVTHRRIDVLHGSQRLEITVGQSAPEVGDTAAIAQSLSKPRAASATNTIEQVLHLFDDQMRGPGGVRNLQNAMRMAALRPAAVTEQDHSGLVRDVHRGQKIVEQAVQRLDHTHAEQALVSTPFMGNVIRQISHAIEGVLDPRSYGVAEPGNGIRSPAIGMLKVLDLALAPADLGSVHVRVHHAGDTVRVEIAASDPSTAQRLKESRAELEQDLRALHMTVEDISVTRMEPHPSSILGPADSAGTSSQSPATSKSDQQSAFRDTHRDQDHGGGSRRPSSAPMPRDEREPGGRLGIYI
jgi:flagellar hook-length control protein FliK